MKYKAAIFDLDGTLLDTLDDISDSVNTVLSAHGFPIHTKDQYRFFIGEGIRELVTRSLPENKRNPEMIQTILDQVTGEYNNRWNKKTRPFPGIIEMLKKLVELKITIAVLSNKPHVLTEKSIRHFFPDFSFAPVIGAGTEFPKKPDPYAAKHISEQLGFNAREILFIGDSDIDMQTAKSAGMTALGVLWGFREGDELLKNGADFLVSKPEELIKIAISENSE